MNGFLNLVAVFISAVIASMGLGGGSLYILYLTFFTDTDHLSAQGLNLMLFLPCALVSVIVYAKKKIIKFKSIWPLVLGGIAGVFIGNIALTHLNSMIIRKIFAAFLVLSGIISLIRSAKKE